MKRAAGLSTQCWQVEAVRNIRERLQVWCKGRKKGWICMKSTWDAVAQVSFWILYQILHGDNAPLPFEFRPTTGA
ncbi:hypothetical protein JOB18_039007 [Solea senegalensis]|uniref:Uncharacterized protein n=1 Tax=Solea senegalensis TaxID=28829 RepID=A0AAV6RX44_SOLSE|nr:hypothetical protein JOB18_039007 [Solea senegalensis]